ncbi:Ig-like domain-containing protein, partial [Stieleria mannarensis]|uniref:Ig-like domain-containing protein n=1 Tax=Stieleria mannarensis TaxID=2755585 RepID=UPI0016020901
SGGGTDQTIGTVNVDITAVNEAPTATGESFTVNPGDSLSVTAPGVIFNDTDVDGDTLAVVLVTGPANGSFSLQPGGSFTYTPNPGFFGQDSFFYRVTDGSLSSNVAEAVIEVPLFSFSGGSFDLTSVEAPVVEDPPSVESVTEPELDFELDLETEAEESAEEAESNAATEETNVSSVTAPASTPKSKVAVERAEKVDGDHKGDRGHAAPSLDDAESSQPQRFAADATVDTAADLVHSYSPELEQLERMLQQDMRQAIVWTQWDDTQTEDEHTPITVFVGAAGAGMSVFSIGYVFWALRGGALMTVFASSLPAWRFIDPIAMLSAYRSSQLTSDEGLEALIGHGNETRGR